MLVARFEIFSQNCFHNFDGDSAGERRSRTTSTVAEVKADEYERRLERKKFHSSVRLSSDKKPLEAKEKLGANLMETHFLRH